MMVLTIVAFAFLVFTWVGIEALQPAHGPRRRQDGGEGRRETARRGRRSPLRAGQRPRGPGLRRTEMRPGPGTPCRESFPGNELVILSTCNRVEIYLAGSPETVPEVEALTDVLVEFHGVRSELVLRAPGQLPRRGRRRAPVPRRGQPGEPGAGRGPDPRPGPRGLPRRGRRGRRSARSSTPSSRPRSRSARRSASRPAWTRASSRSPAWRSTWPGRSSTRSPTRPCWSSAPARWAT